ncbi:MAG TPA: thiamine pyrophosphate-dependent enzyme, partial [Bradyrhizobium sp.]|nr:thiamine pyrophosphate-dependent enzyme [Bradyrhizobium sp.]
ATRVDTRVRPSDEALQALAARLLKSERPVIVAGDEVVKSDALREAAALAEALGCPAFQQSAPYGAHFLSESPCFIGALSRVQTQVREILSSHDLLIVLGADPLRMSVHSETEPLPEGMPIVQIGLVEWDLAKNFGAEIALKANLKETLRALLPALKAKGGAALEARARQGMAALASKNWTARRAALAGELAKRGDRTPIDPDYLTLQVAEAMPENAILVDEGLTSSRQMLNLRPHRDRYGYHGLASGGIGWGLPASVGVSLANPDRPVVCFSGDGSAMYSIQALWTAAHHKLPLNVVIANNGGYRIIKQRLLAFHGDDHYVGMDFADPPVDFAGVAQSLGLEAMRITKPAELKPALASAFGRPGAKLIEVMVDGSV